MGESSSSFAGFPEAVASALLFASGDRTTPVLRSVRVDVGYVTATDRFTLARQGFGAAGCEAPGFAPFAVGVDAAKELAKLPAPVSVAHDVAGGRVTFVFADGGVRVFATVDGFPAVERLWPAGDPVPTGEVALDPRFVARLSRVKLMPGAGRNLPARFEFFGEGKPVRVRIGDEFEALILPVRFPGGGVS